MLWMQFKAAESDRRACESEVRARESEARAQASEANIAKLVLSQEVVQSQLGDIQAQLESQKSAGFGQMLVGCFRR
jgi:hypothetical protein